MAAKKVQKRGFTLIELMIVVAIIGVLAALAIYGVRKYIANAKTAEARNSIGQMAKDASAAYAREGMAPSVLAPGGTAGVNNVLCASASASIPSVKASIQGQKYQSNNGEWAKDGTVDHKGFSCLHFSMTDPQYYMYNYVMTGTGGAENDTFTALANGDLNGDGTLSTFNLYGKIQKGTKGLDVNIAPNIEEVDPEE